MASNVEGNEFKSIPSQIKEKALHRVLMGEAPSTVARDMGMSPSTVLRWCKKEGIERGAAMNPEANPMVVPQPDHVMDAFTKEVRKQNVEAALNMFLQMQDGVEDKYRVLLANQLYGLFHTVMQNPPPIRNWGDVEKAHKIMSDILGINKSTSRNPSKLQIQFDVVRDKPTIVDAEEVEVVDKGIDQAEGS